MAGDLAGKLFAIGLIGAAMLAGLGAGIWPDVDALSKIRSVDRRFEPTVTATNRRARLKTWKRAVKRARNWRD